MSDSIKPYDTAKSMTESEWIDAIQEWPKKVIGQNSKLARTNFYQWTLPAYIAKVVLDGVLNRVYTCPSAGLCKNFCYACQGGYIFKSGMVAHARYLQAWINDRERLANGIISEIRSKRKLAAFRIHDSGDFFSHEYTEWWLDIIQRIPEVPVYAYTKRVKLFKRLEKGGRIPDNFTVIYSYGGKEDDAIDPEVDRHSRVFSSHEEMEAAGYSDTTHDDANGADPSIRCVGLVYHGTLNVDKAMGG